MASKDDEISRLLAALAEKDRELAEKDRKLAAAEQAIMPMMLKPYLAGCHTLSRAIIVITDRSLTTQGVTTDPVGRLCPRRIVPWDDFPARQADTWRQLLLPAERDDSTGAATSTFASRQTFPTQNQIDYVLSVNNPISSEHGLRYFERDTVEIPVKKLMAAAFDDAELRRRFGLHGTVDFESHTNLGDDDTWMSPEDGLGGPATTSAATIRRLRRTAIGRGRGGMADQFCIYRRIGGSDIPAMAIEYKAPHKLSPDEISTGLVAEIQLGRDIINQTRGAGESEFVFASKSLVAAVVTQLFSYMVGKGIQYGYVCTGQVFVFLHIADDPTTVYYHVCVPNVDADDNDDDEDDKDDEEYRDSRLQQTAVAQVFAFMLQAIRAPPPTAAWFTTAAELDTWAVEYDDILARIPPSVRKEKEHASPYKPSRWRGLTRRSPIKTRASQCRPESDGPSQARRGDSDDSDDGGNGGDSSSDPSGGSSPTPNPAERAVARKRAATDNAADHRQGGKKRQQEHVASQAPTPIQDQPYCTHQCLLGLTSGGSIDPTCPNASVHGPRHRIDAETCTRLLAEQVVQERGRDADFAPMYMSGLIGALYKLRLTAYGYTLVAKAVENPNRAFLQEEKRVYDRLRPMQGVQVPVCLGLTDIAKPLYGYGGVFNYILLLSWAGRSLSRYTADDAAYSGLCLAPAVQSVEAAIRQMHELGVLHGDAEARNVLYDARTQALMLVDFERSKIYAPVNSPLTSISRNSLQRSAGKTKTKTRTKKAVLPPTTKQDKRTRDLFTSELRCAVDSCTRCLGGTATGTRV